MRININWQEVLSVWQEDGDIYFSFHFAPSSLAAGNALGESENANHPKCGRIRV
jgi:hypothetical protein